MRNLRFKLKTKVLTLDLSYLSVLRIDSDTSNRRIRCLIIRTISSTTTLAFYISRSIKLLTHSIIIILLLMARNERVGRW